METNLPRKWEKYMRFKIRDKNVDIRFVSEKTLKKLYPDTDLYGFYIEYPDGKKIIRVDKKLDLKKKFEIIIHECLHSADNTLSEKFVQETAESITEILFDLFYIKNAKTLDIDDESC